MDHGQRHSCLHLGELQEQPHVRHLNRAPGHILPRHAARRVLPLPPRVGPMEPPPRGGRGVWVHPRDHRGRHRAAVRGRHTVGGDRRVRGGEGRALPGHGPHVHPLRRDPEEAEAAGESLHEAGHAVPAAGAGWRRVPPDLEWARTEAASRGGGLFEVWSEGFELDRGPAWGPQALVKTN